jgi:shikimate dehydrogenase
MTYQLAVFGNPIAHSLSPKIHPIFAKQFDIAINYRAILAPLTEFNSTCQQFFDAGGYGCNVTAPFKEDAFRFVPRHSEHAATVKVVNTIAKLEGALWGDNTDGQGLVNDLLRNKSLTLANRTIIILGAGGATRGILPALLATHAAKIIIVNRDQEKTTRLLHDFNDPIVVQSISWQALTQYSVEADIVIDATSFLDSYLALSNLPWSSQTYFYDLKYRLEKTPLVHWATQSGFKAHDGFGMLVEQVALDLERWFGVLPNTSELIHNGCGS